MKVSTTVLKISMVLPLVAMLALTGCGGGGGTTKEAGPAPPTIQPPKTLPTPRTVAELRTALKKNFEEIALTGPQEIVVARLAALLENLEGDALLPPEVLAQFEKLMHEVLAQPTPPPTPPTTPPTPTPIMQQWLNHTLLGSRETWFDSKYHEKYENFIDNSFHEGDKFRSYAVGVYSTPTCFKSPNDCSDAEYVHLMKKNGVTLLGVRGHNGPYVSSRLTGRLYSDKEINKCRSGTVAFGCSVTNLEEQMMIGFTELGYWKVYWRDPKGEGGFRPRFFDLGKYSGAHTEIKVLEEQGPLLLEYEYIGESGVPSRPGAISERPGWELPLLSARGDNGKTTIASYEGLMSGIAHQYGNKPVSGITEIQVELNYRNDLNSVDATFKNIEGYGFSIPDIRFPTINGGYAVRARQPAFSLTTA